MVIRRIYEYFLKIKSSLDIIRDDVTFVRTHMKKSLDIIHDDVAFIRTHMSSYLGNDTAITYLNDGTPIYVNPNDSGGPSNLISGGRYEEENLNLLLSFLKDDTVFLDVGANLGFYSLKIARRIYASGKVYAFEPHKRLVELAQRSVYLNGLSGVVSFYPVGLSDKDSAAKFAYPPGHLGGGAIATGNYANFSVIDSEIRTLESLLGRDFKCDLMKIDVEGHELSVLRGMPNVLKNSPNLKILFEKLGTFAGYEGELHRLLSDAGFLLYQVQPDVTLKPIGEKELPSFSGYVLAARAGAIKDNETRFKFSIFPRQLSVIPSTCQEHSIQRLISKGRAGEILFHGPYWYLPKGVWRFILHGENLGGLLVSFATRFGHTFTSFQLADGQKEAVTVVEQDLLQFECVARAAVDDASVNLQEIELIREG